MKDKKAMMIGYFFLGLFLLTGTLSPFGIFTPVFATEDAEGYTSDECMECHQSGSDESALQISRENYDASLHGQAVTCRDCHTGITDDTHIDGEDITPVDCSGCHEMEINQVDLNTLFSSSQITSHKKANFINKYEMDNCLGCHQGKGAHGETEPINDQDCYKCHDPDIEAAMWGIMHPETKNKSLVAGLIHLCFGAFILILLFGRFLAPVFSTFSGKHHMDKNQSGKNIK